MARDRLNGTLGTRRGDEEVLLLLGEVHAAMDDLPAAGAAWFLTTDPGTEVASAAGAAFRARHRTAVARANALPLHRPLEEYPGAALARLHALLGELRADGWSWRPPGRPQPDGNRTRGRHRNPSTVLGGEDGLEPRASLPGRLGRLVLVTVAVCAVVGFFTVWVVGAVTAVRWFSG